MTYDSASYKNKTGTHVFSSNLPHRAPLLCYIAGVECPIQGANVSYGVGKIPEASVQLFPDPMLQGFGRGDRVPLVLFYLDEYIDPSDPTWRLLFEGEIVGWGYTSTTLGRSMSLTCVADISMLTQLYAYYITGVDPVAAGGDVATKTSAVPNSIKKFSIYRRGLIPDDKGEDYIRRPYDLAYNIVRALGSEAVMRPLPCINFFSRWARRQRFDARWVALPYLEEVHRNGTRLAGQPEGVFPILRAASSGAAIEAVEGYTDQSLSGHSYYQALQTVLSTLFMELCMLPTASAVTVKPTGDIIGPASMTTKKHMRLTNYFVKPQMLFGLPPACNVIFPSMTPEIMYQENYNTQPTRIFFEDNALAGLLNSNVDLQKHVSTILARGYPHTIDYAQQQKSKNAAETGHNVLVWPEEFFMGPVTQHYKAPAWLMHYLKSYDEAVEKALLSTKVVKGANAKSQALAKAEAKAKADANAEAIKR